MRIVISDFISLDGVVQAPGQREEDTDGGFKHGGWSMEFFADRMNEIRKYLVSRTLGEDDLTWSNTTLLPSGDALGAIRKLRDQPGKDIQVMGSASLATQLIESDLVDEYRLMIDPIVLGGDKERFPADGTARKLELIGTTTSKTGVHICTYRPTTS